MRLKRDIRAFTDSLDVLDMIRPMRYKWNGLWGQRNDGAEIVGVIAQELEIMAPYAVGKVRNKLYPEGDETEISHIHPEALIYVLINAVIDLKGKLDRIRSEESAG